MSTVTNEFEIHAARQAAWDFLLTPERVAPCVPGCEAVEQRSETEFDVTVGVKVAYANLTFDTHVEITDQDPPRALTAEGTAEPTGRMPGSAIFSGDLTLEEDGDGVTHGSVTIDFGIRGRLGSLGESAFQRKSEELTAQFVDNVKAALEEEAGG